MNRVSVIVPTRNRSNYLRHALESIRALEGPDLEFELIVVDSGSTDDTDSIAHLFEARLLRAPGPGAAVARNEGLRAASAAYVAFLDDDDIWLPGHIRPQLDLLAARPTFAAAIGQVVLADNLLGTRGQPYPPGLPDDGALFRAFLATVPQIGATVARTSVRESVGYFDARYEGDEDWDWHLRLALQHEVGFVAVPCVLFRQRADTSTDLRWLRLRNMRRVFITNVRRSGARGPSLVDALRIFVKHNGRFSAYFAQHAARSRQDGDLVQATIAFNRALLSSPPHALINALGVTRRARGIVSV